MKKTSLKWCDYVWNIGASKRADEEKYKANPGLVWVKPKQDLFHPKTDFRLIQQIYLKMLFYSKQHTYLIFTIYPENCFNFMQWLLQTDKQLYTAIQKTNNIWHGISAQNQDEYKKRIAWLNSIRVKIKTIHLEPLTGKIDLIDSVFSNYPQLSKSIKWIIAGGETGLNPKPMHPVWIEQIKSQCAVAKIPFLFEKWGNWTPDYYPDHKNLKPEDIKVFKTNDNQEEIKQNPITEKPFESFEEVCNFLDNYTWGDYVAMFKTDAIKTGNQLRGETHINFPQFNHLKIITRKTQTRKVTRQKRMLYYLRSRVKKHAKINTKSKTIFLNEIDFEGKKKPFKNQINKLKKDFGYVVQSYIVSDYKV